MTTGGSISPAPDPDDVRKGKPGKGKGSISKTTGGSLPGNPSRGRGTVRRGGRGGK
jgi:hypothetical protein